MTFGSLAGTTTIDGVTLNFYTNTTSDSGRPTVVMNALILTPHLIDAAGLWYSGDGNMNVSFYGRVQPAETFDDIIHASDFNRNGISVVTAMNLNAPYNFETNTFDNYASIYASITPFNVIQATADYNEYISDGITYWDARVVWRLQEPYPDFEFMSVIPEPTSLAFLALPFMIRRKR